MSAGRATSATGGTCDKGKECGICEKSESCGICVRHATSGKGWTGETRGSGVKIRKTRMPLALESLLSSVARFALALLVWQRSDACDPV